jgi:hypothetical protein
MRIFKLIALITTLLVVISGCNRKTDTEIEKFPKFVDQKVSNKEEFSAEQYNNTKGYWEDGRIINEFDCPDSKFFPAIELKSWNKIRVVNGRFPTYAETMNGTSIHHYGEKENKSIKPYNMLMPKLATCYIKSLKRREMVVVIQIVQTPSDTIVGYRYLTGGCGGSAFRNFHFLTDDEVNAVVRN